MADKKQWRVISADYKEIFDNEPEARRAYGKQRNAIRAEEEGRCELLERENIKSQWLLLQEFQLGLDEEEEEEK
jgi:hypothetical protein